MAIQTTVLTVEGMSCQHCVSRVTKAAGSLPGVSAVSVDLAAKTARVEYDPGVVTLDQIRSAIKDQGYEVK